MSFYLVSESCGLQVQRFRNVLIGRHRNRMKPYEKYEQTFYYYSHSIVARVHGVLLHFLSSIRCYLVSYRPNQFRIKG